MNYVLAFTEEQVTQLRAALKDRIAGLENMMEEKPQQVCVETLTEAKQVCVETLHELDEQTYRRR